MAATISIYFKRHSRHNQALWLIGKQAKSYGMAHAIWPVDWRYICHSETFRIIREMGKFKAVKTWRGRFNATRSGASMMYVYLLISKGPAISKSRNR